MKLLGHRCISIVAVVTMVVSFLPMSPVAAQDEPLPGPGRIVGGNPTDPGEYPFLVALVSPLTGNSWLGQFCGGAVIDDMWVMTAAHCVSNDDGTQVSPTSLDVVTGRHDLYCFDFGGSPACTEGQRIDVAEIHRHPQFDKDTFNNDIALLRLATATTSTPVAWATPTDAGLFAAGVVATVMGWGQTESVPAFPDVPYDVNVEILSDADCKAPNTSYPASSIFDDTMLCAGDVASGGVDSCQGDSGGPLVVPDGIGGWLQAGIVSWGIGCADPGAPGVYAQVSAFEVLHRWPRGAPRCHGAHSGDQHPLHWSDLHPRGHRAGVLFVCRRSGRIRHGVLRRRCRFW